MGGIRANSAPPSSSAVVSSSERPLSASRGWACGAAGVPPGAARQPAPSHGSTCSGILGGVRVLQLTHGLRLKLAWHSEFRAQSWLARARRRERVACASSHETLTGVSIERTKVRAPKK